MRIYQLNLPSELMEWQVLQTENSILSVVFSFLSSQSFEFTLKIIENGACELWQVLVGAVKLFKSSAGVFMVWRCESP